MATFPVASMKRKDSEIVYNRQPDFPIFSQTKKIKISLDGELPLTVEEETPTSSPMFETQLQREQEFIFYKPVHELPSGQVFCPENLKLMTAVDEMPIDCEPAGASGFLAVTTPSIVNPTTVCARQETGPRNDLLEVAAEEDPMEVEDETEHEGLHEQPSRAAPMIWILLRKDQ